MFFGKPLFQLTYLDQEILLISHSSIIHTKFKMIWQIHSSYYCFLSALKIPCSTNSLGLSNYSKKDKENALYTYVIKTSSCVQIYLSTQSRVVHLLFAAYRDRAGNIRTVQGLLVAKLVDGFRYCAVTLILKPSRWKKFCVKKSPLLITCTLK